MRTIMMHLSEKQNTFSQILCAFFKSEANFEPFQKNVSVIAYHDRDDQHR